MVHEEQRIPDIFEFIVVNLTMRNVNISLMADSIVISFHGITIISPMVLYGYYTKKIYSRLPWINWRVWAILMAAVIKDSLWCTVDMFFLNNEQFRRSGIQKITVISQDGKLSWEKRRASPISRKMNLLHKSVIFTDGLLYGVVIFRIISSRYMSFCV